MMGMGIRYGSAFSAIAMAIFSSSISNAQEVAPSDSNQEEAKPEIVVTGSYIRGTPDDTALPVDSFTAETLEKSGVSSPLEFIKDLPSVGTVLGDSNQFVAGSQGNQGQGSLNLRGLGTQRTLVLMNGKRTITDPGSGFADTNLIPFFALERIEILKDGAAATYGSDAIAGVANFITRKNFTGIEVKGGYQFIDGSDGDFDVSGLAGFDFSQGDANLIIGAGYQRRSELPSYERDFTLVPYDVKSAGWSTLGNPGAYLPANPAFARAGNPLGFLASTANGLLDGSALNVCEATGGTLGNIAANNASFPICRFTINSTNLVEEQDRLQVYGALTVDLSESLEFHVDALYASTYQKNRTAPSFGATQGLFGPGSFPQLYVLRSNPFVQDFLDQTNNSTAGAASRADRYYFLGRLFGQGGNPAYGNRGALGFSDSDAYRVSGGFEYDVSSTIRMNLDATYTRSTRTQQTPDMIVERVQAALNGFGGANCDPATGTAGVGPCQYLNPFSNSFAINPELGLTNPGYVPGNENDPDLVASLFELNGTVQKEDKFIVDLIFSGDTGLDLAGGPLAFAFGGQYRTSRYQSRPNNALSNSLITPCPIVGDQSCTLQTGPFAFLGQSTPVSLSQDIYAAFVELNAPVTDTLEFTLAARYEDYGNPIGGTFNPKGSVRWEPIDWLVLRGSVGTTFRGPLPSDVDPNSATFLDRIPADANVYKPIDRFGNPNLDPETAFTYNIGAVVKTGGFTASVDYWTYDFDDQIVSTSAQAISNIVANGPGNGTQLVDCASPLRSFVTFDNNDTCDATTTGANIARVGTSFVNGPSVKTSGLDFMLNYDLDTSFGMLSIGGNATRTLKYDIGDFVLNGILLEPGYDAVGYGNFFRNPGSISKWKGNAYANFSTGGLNARYVFKYIQGVVDDRGPGETVEFGPSDFAVDGEDYFQHDFHLAYDFEAFGAGSFQLTASVENIFDTDPSAANLSLGYNPYVGNALGRTFRLGGRVRY